MPSVDVLIPSYQYGRFLRASVKSALDQNVAHLRVLIIDNASSDDSVEVARALAREDPRVQVRARQRNLGLLASFNEGIDWAEADYFLVLCADDLLFPGALAHAVAVMESDPKIAFARGVDGWFKDGEQPPLERGANDATAWRVISGADYLEQSCRRPRGTVGMLVRTRTQKAAGYFREAPGLMADFEMSLRLACLGKVAQTSAGMAIQRLHGSNLSAAYWSDAVACLKHTEAAFESFFTHEGAAQPNLSTLRRHVRKAVASRAYWSGLSRLIRGRAKVARQLLSFAVCRSPIYVIAPPVNELWSTVEPLKRIKLAFAGAFSSRRQ